MDISIDWLFFEYKYKTHNPKFNDRKAEIKLKTLVVIYTDCIGRYKSNYDTIMVTVALHI
jgi:hypothetical protein